MINEQYKYSELTSQIIAAAMEVHSFLGNGFQEIIYQRALSYELDLRKINHEQEFVMPVIYEDIRAGIQQVVLS
jgi:GxxExxY protein